MSTASAYLKPAMTRRNLEVLAETRTRRVLLDGKRAVGVEVQARDGIKRLRGAQRGRRRLPALSIRRTCCCTRVSATSGICKSWGITPVHHLPAVGRHLRDHPAAPIAMETDDPTSYGHSWKALPRNIAQSFRYLATRTRSFGEQPLRDQCLYPDAAGLRPARPAARVPARAAEPAPVPDSARPRLCDRQRVSLSAEHGTREPVRPGPARRAAHRSEARQRRSRFADLAPRLEDGANDLRARELQVVSCARSVSRSRGLVRRAVARAHQAHAHDRPPSGLDVPHGPGRRQRRRPRAQGARARAPPRRRCLDLSAPRGREHERERGRDRGKGVRYDLGQAGAGAYHADDFERP